MGRMPDPEQYLQFYLKQSSLVKKKFKHSQSEHDLRSEEDSPEPHTTKMKSASSHGPTPLSSDKLLYKHKEVIQC